MDTSFNSSKIRNIVFDLGGVILNIDYRLTSQAFRNLGLSNFDELYSQARQSGLFDAFEIGKISESKFVEEINVLADKQIPAGQIVDAWNAMLLDFPVQRLKMLETLGKKYRIFLLSNTNETHQRAFEKILQETFSMENLDPWFERVYFSHHINLRKPDREVFEFVLNESGMLAMETLFIDDSAQHVAGARATGIQSILLEKQPVEELVMPLF